MLDGFQAGLSWITILRKREAFREAFAGFDPERVARFGAKDIARLMGDLEIVRSRTKIDSTILGARLFCEMQERGEDFSELCWSFTDGKPLQGDGVSSFPAETELSARISKALMQRGFKFVGPVIVYAWMQAVGIVNDHSRGCFRRSEVRHPSDEPHARRRTRHGGGAFRRSGPARLSRCGGARVAARCAPLEPHTR